MHFFHASAHEELPDTPQSTNLTKYLHGRKSLQQAVDTFCQPVENKFMDTSRSEAVESLLLEAWSAVVAVAGATPHASENRQKLADFVMALTDRPTLMKGDQTAELYGRKVWRGLPGLGLQMREAWNMGKFVSPGRPVQC